METREDWGHVLDEERREMYHRDLSDKDLES